MLSVLKAPTLALLVLAILSLVCASPFSSVWDSEEVPSLWSRAVGGKYVGSPCQSNAECYSENCAPTDHTTKKTCQRQPVGGPCFKSSNCLTRNCASSNNTCVSPSKVLGTCASFQDCNGGFDASVYCFNGICQIQEGYACSRDKECNSGYCKDKVCRRRPGPPNSPCDLDSECLSGNCTLLDTCFNADGAYTYCDAHTVTHCGLYPLGHSCSVNGDCGEGFCINGTCQKGKDGDRCYNQVYQCISPSLCSSGPDPRCFTPANHSLPPASICRSNEQCQSQRCLYTRLFVTDDGYHFLGTQLNTDPPECDYLYPGEGTCRTYADCAEGLCKSGTCELGNDGDRCLFTFQCAGICGNDSRCFTPAKGTQYGAGAFCHQNSDCLSNNCQTSFDTYTRPLPDNPSQNATVPDTVCFPSKANGACQVTSDCSTGSCVKGVCKELDVGATCGADSECNSQVCYKGKCGLATTFAGCSTNDFCWSGVCEDGPCYSHSCQPSLECASVPLGGKCRIDDDCGPNAVVCDTDKTCKSIDGSYCHQTSDCKQGSQCTKNRCTPTSTTTTSKTTSVSATSKTSSPTSSSSITTASSTTSASTAESTESTSKSSASKTSAAAAKTASTASTTTSTI